MSAVPRQPKGRAQALIHSVDFLGAQHGQQPFANAVARFRATGTGWQTRMDAALQDWLRTHAHD